MADKKRLLDVWLVDGNTVYRDVPFAVVTDWIQQGRLLPEDRARLAGSKVAWIPLGKIPAFAPYLPKAEPQAVEDRAEALEPVEVDFHWKKRHDAEEDDPDMIPLIDVSLVLLIFFMMTASTQSGMFSPIDTPAAKHQLAAMGEGMFWVGVEKDKQDQVLYSFGKDEGTLTQPQPGIKSSLDRLRTELDRIGGEVRLRIRADKDLPARIVRDTQRDLKQLEIGINQQRQKAGTERIKMQVTGEVSEPVD